MWRNLLSIRAVNRVFLLKTPPVSNRNAPAIYHLAITGSVMRQFIISAIVGANVPAQARQNQTPVSDTADTFQPPETGVWSYILDFRLPPHRWCCCHALCDVVVRLIIQPDRDNVRPPRLLLLQTWFLLEKTWPFSNYLQTFTPSLNPITLVKRFFDSLIRIS